MNRPNDETLGKLLRKNKRLTRDLTRIETGFNAIRSAIIVSDSNGEIQFANNYARSVLGIGDKVSSIYKLLSGMEEAVMEVAENDNVICRHTENFRKKVFALGNSVKNTVVAYVKTV